MKVYDEANFKSQRVKPNNECRVRIDIETPVLGARDMAIYTTIKATYFWTGGLLEGFPEQHFESISLGHA